MKVKLLATLIALVNPVLGSAANISLVADDALNTTSFNTGLNWSDGNPPGSGNDYYTENFRLRTPPDGGSYTFGGDSLTVNNTNGYSWGLLYKGTGASGTITINNLILDGGLISHANGLGDVFNLAGSINVVSPSTIYAKQGNINVPASISGTGDLIISQTDAPTQDDRYVNLLGNNSGFTGKLAVNGRLRIVSEESLGGNPASFAADQLTLDGGGNGGWLAVSNSFSIDDPNRGITIGSAGAQIVVTNPDTNTVTSLTISSPITGFGNLTKAGNGSLTLSGNNDFSGTLTFSGGAQLNLNSPTALGFGSLTLASEGMVLDNASGSAITWPNNNTVNFNNSFTFLGSSSLNMGTGSAILFGNVTVTVANNTLTTGTLFDDGLNRSLTKQGPGTLTLNGGSFVNGPLIAGDGVLAIAGPGAIVLGPSITVLSNATLDVTGAGGLTLQFGQTLGGDGTVAGDVTDTSGSFIAPGTSAGTLTVNGNLTLNGGGALNYELSDTTEIGGGTNDLLVVTGQLNLAGPTTVDLSYLSGAPAVGTYTLIQYGSLSGSVNNLMVPPGFSVNNNTADNTIELIVTHVPAELTWRGDGVANIWDLGTTANWRHSGASQVFFTGDHVTFDDTGSNAPAINLAENVSPGSVTVNASQDYTFTGGAIASGTLTKNGSGRLILDNTNTYNGLTLIEAGTVQVGDPFAGNFGFAGSLGAGVVSNNASLVFSRADNLTVPNQITGSGSITKLGLAGVVLGGSNDYSGLTTISEGTLQAANDSALGSTVGGTVIEGGAQLNAFANRTINENLTLNPADTSTMVLRNGGNATFVINGTIDLNSDSAIQVDGGSTMVFSNEVSGIGGLQKNVNGTLVLAASNSFSGGLTVNSGTLALAHNDAVGDNSEIVVNSTTGGANGGTRVTLSGGVTIPSTISLSLPSTLDTVRSVLNASGSGATNTWSGPISVNGDGIVQFRTDAGATLHTTGPVSGTATRLIVRGNSLTIISGPMTLSSGNAMVQTADGAALTINSTGNSWATNLFANNGRWTIGANNAIPTGSVFIQQASDTGSLDLNGFNQQIAGLDTGSQITITNTSAVSDSTLTFSGGASTYAGLFRDGTRALNLTVAAGNFTLTDADSLNIPRSTVTVASGAVLQLDFTGTNTVAELVLNGVPQGPGLYNSTTSSPLITGTGNLLVSPPPITPPQIDTTTLAAGNLILDGSGGPAGSPFDVLSSTNAAQPLIDWTVTGSGTFDGSGNFSVTNAVTPGEPKRFFLITIP